MSAYACAYISFCVYIWHNQINYNSLAPKEMSKNYSESLQCQVTHSRETKTDCPHYITSRSYGCRTKLADITFKTKMMLLSTHVLHH